MSPESYDNKVNRAIQLRIGFFDEAIQSSQNAMYRAILSATRDFDLNANGTIKTTQKNIKSLTRLRVDLENLVLNDTYVERVNQFTNAIPELKGINDQYFKAITGTFTPNAAVYESLTSIAIQDTASSLLASGINPQVIDPISKMITDSVFSGWSFQDMVDNLRLQVLGNDERLGLLQKHASQIVTDSLNQFNATYTNVVSQDLGLVFYFYSGGIKDTTRSYCRTRAGKWFHIEEIRKDIPETWSGKIAGTDKSNILVRRGGYNCGHQYVPAMVDVVPADVVERARAKGYYK